MSRTVAGEKLLFIAAILIKQIRQQGVKYVQPQEQAQKKWKAHINEPNEMSLFPTVSNTYTGGKYLER